MVRIRLSRVGTKKRPFYRIVAIDDRSQRDGRPLEFLGTYDPLSDPPKAVIRSERLEEWFSRGAQATDAVRALLRRAQRQSSSAPAPESPARVEPGAA